MGQWDSDLLSLLPPSCKIFAAAGAGYDWADIPAFSARGILYCNGAQASSEAVADTAIWHILSVFRNLMWSAEAAKSGDPERFREAHKHTQDSAFNPRGKRLGVVGLGNIGGKIAEKAVKGFGMEVWYFDVVRKSEQRESDLGARYCGGLEELVGSVDCVVLAAPFQGEKIVTEGLLGAWKKGGRLVNVARGGLVDEKALVQALRSGRLCAAGLDVHENEPHVNQELCQMRNVSLTCHTAGGAWETASGFERLAMENVESFLQKGVALTPVNADAVAAKTKSS